jgi:hypothetical protein
MEVMTATRMRRKRKRPIAMLSRKNIKWKDLGK